ncbi:hypothetical protein VCRA2128O98_50162 [Vibrio crassostreae]|nr:hypothetical protein VCRA2125O83_50163 [Vibrio crassostreae]CAK3038695.1 hypothetical protein VCRA2126O86_50162 [Vibrio crassostreae]CAK3041208.1 hypothetical protein VCRA2127O91_50163 [Vibrio crassostreae]CAK3042815.1 hypothetical protein VCRA2128O100_50162 [Vibrio crassostreae]CAK3043712.1 hypothetical protein VCRA2126O84_50162 [Vibrio crassostreae]
MRLYLKASINFLDGYPASERTPEYWLSWSLEYLCVEHVRRRISKRNGISHDFEQSTVELPSYNGSAAQSKHCRTVKTTQKI